MLTLEQALLYTPAALLVIAIPGPDMMLSLARAHPGASCRFRERNRRRRRHHDSRSARGTRRERAFDRE
jgi:hypothetical protein